jgi:sugar phosphate isomerase/epimerase
MRLAFSTNAFTKFSLLESMRIIRDIGYQGIEIMADLPHLWPMEAKEEELRSIAQTSKDLDIELCNLNGFMMKALGDIHHPSWIEPEEEQRNQRKAHTAACLRTARALGIPSVSTEPGGPLQGMARDRALSLFKEGLQEMSPLCLDQGIRLLIEPEPGLLFSDLEETIGFLRNLNLPGVGINFDVGHFFCVGLNPVELIEAFPLYLEHIHIEDIGSDRIHHHLIPGHGAMDFKVLFQALHQVNYGGYVTVELYPYEEEPIQAAEEAYRFLSPYLAG